MAKNGGAEAPSVTATTGRDQASLIDHVEVTCEALLGRGTITIGELERLKPGETLTLDSSPADLAEVRVNGKVIARGEVVTIGDHFAIRLTEIG